ncbi:4-aminobutyrate--2-oxoglutarate transaminase [Mammaliicoccus sciuri]|uniref:4-aminobutyrate--2-oxoglutarate transaminase n=1 Tax=Mammaliicoccus TaxID=2803850 RepID=UPI001E574407|nr:4-aminobutyrate--2-oxoglutarate transaminase [Mammaliicoccus sciuri]MCD8777526.1 4-aminobutyrate--2-oxoglutarate transaminase [Mammaliicoccus sciuri]MCD8782173.1 4-aminobutyrate--2-oxoglutarate transaminase [Mammaliicoccus sciuri]MEB6057449.1 4-aminobutyrate--2-oxoglutarate transaminase [Mammaliicoccus sciuri]MEB8372526.1 4-aminobutyrate--2-oxoglutarate transaminase [Mammaliicoccus sciuri]
MGKTQEQLESLRNEYVARGVSNGNTHIADFAKGATVTDKDGTEWIDFAGAIGTLNVGHSHPKITEHLKNELERFILPGFNVIMYESYIKLAEKLAEITPGDHKKKTVLLNSGAEAVENAVKIARKYTGRQQVVSFVRGFHGRTNLTMSMTSKVRPYKFGFGPFAPEVYQAPYPYLADKPGGLSDEAYIDSVIKDLKNFFIATVDPSEVACVVIEPVQGEGGFIIPDKKFIHALKDICEEHGIVFIADEIQTGFARTGKTFAIEHFDVIPDLMTVSKSLAAGFPLSGVVGRSEIVDSPNPGEIGGTYAGNPLACEAALKVIEIIGEENLNAKAEQLGATIQSRLEAFKLEHSFIGDIRRLGAMVAMEIVDPETQSPDKVKTSQIVKAANENGLLLLSAGINGNVIRFLAPLVITDQELNKGLSILESSL